MLSSRNRIKKEKDLSRVFKSRKKFSDGKSLILKISENNLEFSRFAFVVGKKVSKKAVQRNSIKRKLSEIARTQMPGLDKGWDLILIALPGIKEEKNLEAAVISLFKKARIVK